MSITILTIYSDRREWKENWLEVKENLPSLIHPIVFGRNLAEVYSYCLNHHREEQFHNWPKLEGGQQTVDWFRTVELPDSVVDYADHSAWNLRRQKRHSHQPGNHLVGVDTMAADRDNHHRQQEDKHHLEVDKLHREEDRHRLEVGKHHPEEDIHLPFHQDFDHMDYFHTVADQLEDIHRDQHFHQAHRIHFVHTDFLLEDWHLVHRDFQPLHTHLDCLRAVLTCSVDNH